MNLLSVERLSKSYGDKILFSEISFGIEHGQRVALVAQNGAGKSTLLNILAGKEIRKASEMKDSKAAKTSSVPTTSTTNDNEDKTPPAKKRLRLIKKKDKAE